MNLLKINITEVNFEEIIYLNDSKDDLNSYTNVDITTECYGIVNHITTKFPTKEWEEIKKQGYFMA